MHIKKACVTGASGFVGRHLVARLINKGYHVNVLVRNKNNSFPQNVSQFVGDLSDDDELLDFMIRDCDVVFHCAAELKSISKMQSVNILGTSRLLGCVIKNNDKLKTNKTHWVQLSSIGVYGSNSRANRYNTSISETTICTPQNEYEKSKYIADNLIIEAGKKKLISYSILRPSNVIGRDMSNKSLIKLIKAVSEGKFFYIGKPGAVANYVHVDDVVSALLKCAELPAAKEQVYNLSSDCVIEDLIKTIAIFVGARNPWLRMPELPLRKVIGILDNKFNLPLTQSRIDALVRRNYYPCNKIISDLDFEFLKPMPFAVKEMVKAQSIIGE